MKERILYMADIHGNEVQCKKLVKYAKKISPYAIIIGGDIAPKGLPIETYIEAQRKFLEHELPEIFLPLKEASNSKLFLMMGNDDCAANLDVLEKSSLYQTIHRKRARLSDDFDIVGYSHVPITPFGIKDWEKYDLTEAPLSLIAEYANRKRTDYRLDGFKTAREGWKKFKFDTEIEKLDSIQKDLADELFCKNAEKTVYVFHAPPNNTNLDKTYFGHVGSMAVRLFIEKQQPYLTLHGHVHETVNVSKSFKDHIGGALCMSPGNHDSGDRLAVLVFDLRSPKDARRIIL